MGQNEKVKRVVTTGGQFVEFLIRFTVINFGQHINCLLDAFLWEFSAVTTLQPFNIIYTLMFGWWLAAIYLVVGAIMYFTVIGRDYGK